MAKLKDSEVLELATKIFHPEANPHRAILERTWLRNILYYLGEQWLQWYSTLNTFGRRYEINVNVPTPVSNIIRDYVRSLKALTINKSYTTTIWPNSQEQADKDAADLGVGLLEYLDSMHDNAIEDVKEEVELWRVLTGNAFPRVMINMDTGVYKIGKDGKPLPSQGEVDVFCEIPFNLLVPDIGVTMREKAYVATKNLVTKEWVEDTYKVKIKEGGTDIAEVDYQKMLLTLIANVSPWKGRGIEGGDLVKSAGELVVYKTIQCKPTPKHPRGMNMIVCGDKVLVNEEEMPIPVSKTGEWFYDVTHFIYDSTPGNFWATGGVDDLISPQNTINRIDQALEINRDSLGRPFVLTPSSVTLKRLSSKGQGLLSIQYSGRESMGSRPVVHAGTPYPQQILEERNIHREVAQTAAGDPKNILKGQAPSSSASGVMLDILRETAEQSHAPDVRRFFRAWNRVQRKRLILAQAHYTESRMIKIKGEGNDILVKKFKGADLRGNVDVRLELDSGISSTNVGKNQFLMELIRSEFWGPISERPQIQRELLKRMGLGGFPEQQNLHRDRAEYENSELAAKSFKSIAFPGIPKIDEFGEPLLTPEGMPEWEKEPVIDPVFRLDNHLVHMQVHDQYILSREFETEPEEVQMRAIAHRVMHKHSWEAEQMERMAMEQQAAMAGNEAEQGEAPATGQSQGSMGGGTY